MKIDITREPPTDIFRDRGKYLRIFMALLSLAVSGMLLMVYGFVSDTPQSDTLEKTSLALLVAPSVVFGYFGGKLRAYIRLNPRQKKILADLCRKHAEISTYCGLVAKEGREPILAEYHACQDWAEDVSNKRKQAEKK
ncbi:MAG: hypothetical protein L6365_00530 [Desulfobulbaceae bacterium]|nr:hypothetical protein [Desulfobulbaceae bacterium]